MSSDLDDNDLDWLDPSLRTLASEAIPTSTRLTGSLPASSLSSPLNQGMSIHQNNIPPLEDLEGHSPTFSLKNSCKRTSDTAQFIQSRARKLRLVDEDREEALLFGKVSTTKHFKPKSNDKLN